MGIGDWGLGIGDWGLGIGPNPQSPIPNPQSPLYCIELIYYINKLLNKHKFNSMKFINPIILFFFTIIIIIITIILVSNFSTCVCHKIKIKQKIPDTNYAQAPIPPTISVIMDMPQYGRKGLEKWIDYIEANKKMIRDYEIRHDRSQLQFYQNRMNRIAQINKELVHVDYSTDHLKAKTTQEEVDEKNKKKNIGKNKEKK